MKHEEFSERIIGCAYTVSNELGAGYLESVYENSLVHELRKNGLNAQQQCPLKVNYDGVVVGEFFVDTLVENTIILELKAMRAFDNAHMAQCLNYLKATGLEVALLINFGTPRIQVKRIVR